MDLKQLQTKGGALKAQMMSLTALLIFVLMFTVFFAFIVINIQYNKISESSALSQTYVSTIQNIRYGAPQFAAASTQTAVTVLGYYFYNKSMSGSNTIGANLIPDVSYLITNGMIPGVASNSITGNYLSRGMGTLTFQSYNYLLLSNFSNSGLYVVNETNLNITRPTHSTLFITYLENVIINQSSGNSRYSIPINITLSLNSTTGIS